MERVALACRADFESRPRRLDGEAGAVEDARGDLRASGYPFRGHGDANYPLQTALGRFFAVPLSLAASYRLARSPSPAPGHSPAGAGRCRRRRRTRRG